MNNGNFYDVKLYNDDSMEYYNLDAEYLDALNMSKYKLLSKEETYELIKKAKTGDDIALNKLCMHNSRLILNNAKKYLGLAKYKVDLSDLMQVGFLGLIKAIKKFDLSRNISFSTYATHWIRHHILRHIQENNLIHMPINCQQNLYTLKKAIQDYYDTYNEYPNNEELLEWLNTNDYPFDNNWHYNKKQIEDYLKYDILINNLDSIDKEVKRDNQSDNNYIKDNLISNFPSPEDIIIKLNKRDILIDIVKSYNISEQNKKIFLEYYGLVGDTYYSSLSQIADKYNKSHQAVQQLCDRVLAKLRKSPRVKRLLEEE